MQGGAEMWRRLNGQRMRVLLGGGLLLLSMTVALGLRFRIAQGDELVLDQGALRVDNGLQLRLSVPPGPYFRTELLPVTLTLSNQSAHPILYAGALGHSFCGGNALYVAMTQHGTYVDPLSIPFSAGCDPLSALPLAHTLQSGTSIHLQFLLGLPTAGHFTLTGQVNFPRGTRLITPGLLTPGGLLDGLRHVAPGLFRSSHIPFAAGWPTLTVSVSPTIPANRVLHVVRYKHGVYLVGYRRGLPTPVGQQLMSFVEGQGSCSVGSGDWWPLRANALHDGHCAPSEHNELWQVMVGAPGYAIFSAQYCFNPIPSGIFDGSSACSERIFDHPVRFQHS